MPPGGFRLAVINATDLDGSNGRAARLAVAFLTELVLQQD